MVQVKLILLKLAIVLELLLRWLMWPICLLLHSNHPMQQHSFKIIKSPSFKDDIHQDWLKLAQWKIKMWRIYRQTEWQKDGWQTTVEQKCLFELLVYKDKTLSKLCILLLLLEEEQKCRYPGTLWRCFKWVMWPIELFNLKNF